MTSATAKPTSSKKRFHLFRQKMREQAFEPEQDQDGQPAKPQTTGRFSKRWSYLSEYGIWNAEHRTSLVWICVLSAIGIGFDMVGPLLTVHAITALTDTAMPASQRLARVGFFCGLAAAFLMISSGLNLRRYFMTTQLNAKLLFRLRHRVFDRILHLPVHELSDLKTGGIITRLSTDVDRTTGLLQLAFLSPLLAVIRLILAFVLMMTLSWQLGVAVLAMLVPIVVFHTQFVRRIRPIYRSMSKDRSEIDGRVSEAFNGIRVVRGFCREFKERLEYAVGHHTVTRKTLFAEKMEFAINVIWELLLPLSSLIILAIGGWLVIRGDIALAVVFGCQHYIWKLIEPLMQIARSVTDTQRGLAALERVLDILRRSPDKPDVPDAIEAPAAVREIEFANVTFAYRPDVTVIHDFSLKVPGGSVVALVGPSGAGKTTITDLVARFHDPTAGTITLNGLDVRKLQLRSFRQMLGVVQQDVFLFDGTVAENIGYGRREAGRAQIVEAAKRANADEFIAKLPEGYDTLIGERGVKLSGGQRQRLSIARAILADPRILILDEATSNLDTESEQLIQAAMKDLLANRTTFVIAHRLSTITHADCIVVLDRGRIKEVGTHDALMAKQGMYHDMVLRQRQRDGMGDQADWELEKNSA